MSFVLLQHRTIGTLVHLHSFVCHCINGEKKQYFAEADVIHPEPKCTFRDFWRPDEHIVLAIGLLQFPRYKLPWRNAHCSLMFFMRNKESLVKTNKTLCGVRFLETQSIQKCLVLCTMYQKIYKICKICFLHNEYVIYSS